MTNRILILAVALLLLCSGCAAPAVQPAASSTPPQTSVADTSTPDISVPEASAPDSSVPDKPAAVPKPSPQPAVNPPAEEVAVPDTAVEPEPAPPVEESTPPEDISTDSVPEPDAPAIHIPDTRPTLADYDFAAPVPESFSVGVEYFADAAFVGDSRTEGFWLYSGIKQGTLLSATGLTVFSVDSKTAFNSNQTVLQALTGGQFGKIYLAFGINELGYIDTESFVQAYCQLIDTIRAAQPDAIIYIQNLIPVNDAKARAAGLKGHVNCDRVRLYNEFIAQIAREKQVPLLDLYSAFAVDGQLPADASRDGVHLLPGACKRQLNYLMSHTMAPTPPPQAEPAPELPTETEGTEI